jgi:hypothetical protein
MKVESFELTDPLGNKNIFAKFEDGLVFYKFPGIYGNQHHETSVKEKNWLFLYVVKIGLNTTTVLSNINVDPR